MLTRSRLRRLALPAIAVLLAPGLARASAIDALVQKLGGDNEVARSAARQQLPRQDPVRAVPKILPLLASDKPAVWWAAFNVLSDIANDVSVPGREAERSAVAASLMTLVAPEQPTHLKLRGLRLLPLAVPRGFDVGPIAALLADAELREKARVALQELGTPEACAALRGYLPKADAAFQCALLNALGELKDAESLAACRALAASDDARVRAAAIRAMAWTGDPSHLATAKGVVRAADAATRPDAMDALLRLLNAVVEKGGNWQIAVEAYQELLRSHVPLDRQAALAALGRIGDGSCVPPVLAAIRDADEVTWLVGVGALREMQGVDVARAIVEAYPSLPPRTQLAMIPVLGGKKHPLVVPVLKQAAQSDDAAFRVAALEALGVAGAAEGLDLLAAAAQSGGDAEKAAARGGLIALADALRARGRRPEAGRAYLAAYQAAPAADQDLRGRALQGLAGCPTAEAYDVAKAVAGEKEMRDVSIRLLLGVAEALMAANQKDKAIELYGMVGKMSPPMDVLQAVVKGMHAAGAKVDLQGLLGIVTNWWVVGPFELGEQNKGWDVAYVDEPNVNLVGRYMTGKRRVQWTPVVSTDPNGKINLRATVADTDNAIAYAYTEITVPEATEAVLLLGVDDSERVWVNGQKVYEQFTARGLTVDQDRVPVKLRAGANKVLLKIWQNTLGWEFCLRIVKPDGSPLTFTQKRQ